LLRKIGRDRKILLGQVERADDDLPARLVALDSGVLWPELLPEADAAPQHNPDQLRPELAGLAAFLSPAGPGLSSSPPPYPGGRGNP
jgi:hypothetical protein